MILYWYTHWFWITILMVYTSVVETIEVESTTHSSINNNSSNHNGTAISMGKIVSNTTKTSSLSTSEITTNAPATLSTSAVISLGEDATTVIEANITSASSTSNSSEEEILTTLETSYLEAGNESLIVSDRSSRDESESKLSAAGITGITLGCVVLVAILCSLSYIWYRNRGFNRPQVLTDRSSNLDSSGYIDDTSVRDNSEEMYSLDNDSFLNSLEAMTIQNYWTDTVKHTKL